MSAIDNNRLIQNSPCGSPDWFRYISNFVQKIAISQCIISQSQRSYRISKGLRPAYRFCYLFMKQRFSIQEILPAVSKTWKSYVRVLWFISHAGVAIGGKGGESFHLIFKPLSYCFEETIVFDVKASFTCRPVSRLISWYNNQVIQQKTFAKRLFSSTGLFMDWKSQTFA